MSLFAGTALWGLVIQSDMVTWCVLGTLFVMSVASWTVSLYKLTMTPRLRQQVRHATQVLDGVHSTAELELFVQRESGSAIGSLAGRIKSMMHHASVQDRSNREWVQGQIGVACDEILSTADEGSVVVKASVEAAPLLGLLGTIWGLMHSFMRISQEQVADITTVAPGIAEALVTTFMGLLVAIPALVFFHMIYRSLQQLEHDVMLCAESAERAVMRVYGEHRGGL